MVNRVRVNIPSRGPLHSTFGCEYSAQFTPETIWQLPNTVIAMLYELLGSCCFFTLVQQSLADRDGYPNTLSYITTAPPLPRVPFKIVWIERKVGIKYSVVN